MQDERVGYSAASRLLTGDHRFLAYVGGFFLLVLNAAGCSKSSNTVSVSGHVAYRSEPINSGTVTFFPVAGRPVSAAISGGDYKADLAPGDYTVTVSLAPELPPGYKEGDPPPPPPKVVLPDTYTARAKSTLSAKVAAGQSEPIDFDLK
jgi:hypothetical protein